MQKVLWSEEEEEVAEDGEGAVEVPFFAEEAEELGGWHVFFFSYLRTSSERHRSPLGKSKVGKPHSLKVRDFLKASISVLAMQRSKEGADEEVVFEEETVV